MRRAGKSGSVCSQLGGLVSGAHFDDFGIGPAARQDLSDLAVGAGDDVCRLGSKLDVGQAVGQKLADFLLGSGKYLVGQLRALLANGLGAGASRGLDGLGNCTDGQTVILESNAGTLGQVFASFTSKQRRQLVVVVSAGRIVADWLKGEGGCSVCGDHVCYRTIGTLLIRLRAREPLRAGPVRANFARDLRLPRPVLRALAGPSRRPYPHRRRPDSPVELVLPADEMQEV
jgi:hypothetical protein